mmetsp:Transcript_12279/g.14045  ORF Transcript_12279/g.14045 Transcript_12279/m.14045 type:complete len:388 (+) Transcript_12279:114-1277(+)
MAQYAPRNPDYLSNTLTGTLESKWIKSPKSVKYSIILPPNHDKSRSEPYPLILSLHPGMADRDHLIDPNGAARTGRDVSHNRPVVWVSFSNDDGDGSSNGMYMDTFDGLDNWINFVVDDLIPFMEQNYNCGGQQKYRYVTGICMGGLGALKFAFQHPHLFAAIVAQQPAMPTGVSGADLPYNDKLDIGGPAGLPMQSDHSLVTMYGAQTFATTDSDFFRKNVSPIAMAIDNAENIRKSKVKLYIDVGDEDFLNLQNAAELLHRVLWSNRIRHEYHLVHGGDHGGSSWRRRGPEAMDFLWREMENAIDPQLTTEEVVWIEWVKGGRKEGEEPPLKKEIKDEYTGGFGDLIFSDKPSVYMAAVMNVEKGDDAVTDGPEEMMGYKWRNKK